MASPKRMSKSGRLVAITGPAAAGKSTLARALQSELSNQGALWLLVEIDAFASSLMRDWFSFDTHRARYGERGFAYRRDDDGALRLAIGADGRRVLSAFHRSVAAIVRSGVDVVCETVVCDDDDWSDWSEVLEGVPTCWVKLTAPLAVLEAREKDRPRQIRGLARGMMANHSVGEYNISADTSVETMNQMVERIVASMRRTKL